MGGERERDQWLYLFDWTKKATIRDEEKYDNFTETIICSA